LSDDPVDIPKDKHSVLFFAHEFYHRQVVKERNRIHRAILADSPVKLLYRPGGIEAPTERALSESEKAFLLNRMRICRTRRGGHIRAKGPPLVARERRTSSPRVGKSPSTTCRRTHPA
jgi:hypothetical protein